MLNNKSLVMINKKRSPAAEAYRMLRTNLMYAKNGAMPQTLVITSSRAGEGKTTTYSNISLAFAQIGKKVLLIDGDIRKPSLHQLFGTSKIAGLSSVIRDATTLDESIIRFEEFNLDFLPSGPSMSDPTEILSSSKMIAVFEELKTKYDLIIVDTPPVGVVTDTTMFAPVADGYLFVVSEGASTVSEFKQAKGHLEKIGVDILGVVFNKMGAVLGKDSYYYKYYYNRYYYYGYGRDASKKGKNKKSKSSGKRVANNEIKTEENATNEGENQQ